MKFIQTISINIKTLCGKTIILEVEPNETINNIKNKIESTIGIRYHNQKLIFCGQQIHKGSLKQNGINLANTIYLIQNQRINKSSIIQI
mmetsp:Transcript_17025/g.20930  ORF Transcript_17025/g.20930 Transcript_17025/m.20930 type:complete len:89 (-) Transcript_17025:58-324(-)